MRRILLLFVFLFLSFSSMISVAQETQQIIGAGPSTKIAQLFFANIPPLKSTTTYQFVIPKESMKHAGGINASDKYLFGRTGRPLSGSEKLRGKAEIFLAQIPIVFVIGKRVGISKIQLNDLKSIVNREITNWQQIGGPNQDIQFVGREVTEAAFSELKKQYPFMQQARFDLILSRDHQVVNYIKSARGDYSLAFGVSPNFKADQILTIEQFRAGIRVGLVYDIKNNSHEMIQHAKIFSDSVEWHAIVENHGWHTIGSTN